MRGLRLVLIPVFAALLNLDGPSPPERSDDFEEFLEAVHGRSRIVRSVPDLTPEPAGLDRSSTPSRPAAVPVRTPVFRRQTRPRKRPPARSDLASRSDDH
jgi:hypothetical protein